MPRTLGIGKFGRYACEKGILDSLEALQLFSPTAVDEIWHGDEIHEVINLIAMLGGLRQAFLNRCGKARNRFDAFRRVSGAVLQATGSGSPRIAVCISSRRPCFEKTGKLKVVSSYLGTPSTRLIPIPLKNSQEQ
jgi:hypothetical protein